jgi:hypothetical protein
MKRKTKRGQSKKAVEARLERFYEVCLANGENGTRAYMDVFEETNENVAGVSAHRLLKKPKAIEYLERRRKEIKARYALTTERLYQEVARLCYYDPGKLVDKNGKPLPIHEIDEDTRAALAAIEMEVVDGRVTYRSRPHDKNAALEKGLKLVRAYDAPPPPPPDEDGKQPVDVQQTTMRIAFLLRKNRQLLEKKS